MLHEIARRYADAEVTGPEDDRGATRLVLSCVKLGTAQLELHISRYAVTYGIRGRAGAYGFEGWDKKMGVADWVEDIRRYAEAVANGRLEERVWTRRGQVVRGKMSLFDTDGKAFRFVTGSGSRLGATPSTVGYEPFG